MCSHRALCANSISFLISPSSQGLREGSVPKARYCQWHPNTLILYQFHSNLHLLQIPVLIAARFTYYSRLQTSLTASNYFLTSVILKCLYSNKWTTQYVVDHGSHSLWQWGYHMYLISFAEIYNFHLNCHLRTAYEGMRSSWEAYYEGSLYDIH